MNTIVCRVCGRVLNEETWSVGNKKIHNKLCKSCARERSRKWYHDHPEYKNVLYEHNRGVSPQKKREWHRQYRERLKLEVFSHYSPGRLKCANCGFEDIRALSVDHVAGGGNVHRELLGNSGGTNFYKWLKNNEFPEGYQILCMNCQFIKKQENSEHLTKFRK